MPTHGLPLRIEDGKPILLATGRPSCGESGPDDGWNWQRTLMAEKRVEAEKSGCQWIKILTYNAELQHEESV